MANNQQRTVTQVIGNQPFEINVALQALQTQLDEIQGLRGRAKIFDRVLVSNPTTAGDALNLGDFGERVATLTLALRLVDSQGNLVHAFGATT